MKPTQSFWTWSILVFLATQGAELVQSIVGLWLIPHYVPASDIGAVLPMTQTASLLALPLVVLMVPVSRWLTIYAVNGERGKLKSLLRAATFGSLVAIAIMMVSTWILMPRLLRSVRISEPGLPVLLLAAGAAGAAVPVFNGTLQGLQRFGTVVCAGVVSAPLRLLVSVALMPLRAISGYLAGMAIGSVSHVAVAWFGVRREVCSDAPACGFWREDGPAMLRYAAPLVLSAVIWNSLGVLQAMLIRVNLPEIESAAYYVVTQFGNVAGWFGNAVLFVAFPFVASAQARDETSLPILSRALLSALVVGTVVALAFWPFATCLLESSTSWSRYADYSCCIPLWALRAAMGAAISCFMGCEQARGNFRYLCYLVPCFLVESCVLFALHDVRTIIGWFVITEIVQLILIFIVIRRRRRFCHVA